MCNPRNVIMTKPAYNEYTHHTILFCAPYYQAIPPFCLQPSLSSLCEDVPDVVKMLSEGAEFPGKKWSLPLEPSFLATHSFCELPILTHFKCALRIEMCRGQGEGKCYCCVMNYHVKLCIFLYIM